MALFKYKVSTLIFVNFCIISASLISQSQGRNLDTRNFYDISSTSSATQQEDGGDENNAQEIVIFANSKGVIDEQIIAEVATVEEISPGDFDVLKKGKEKTRCVGPATLMAFCF